MRKWAVHCRTNRVYAQVHLRRLAGDRTALQAHIPLPQSPADVLE